MADFKSIRHDIADSFRSIATHKSTTRYDVMMGLLCTSILAVVELVTYFVLPAGSIRHPYFFLAAAALMAIFFVAFVAIYRHGFVPGSAVQKAMMVALPFVVILIGVAVTYAFQGISNHSESYLIAIFAAAFIQVYPKRRRLLIFAFGFVLFNAMMLAYHGFSEVTFTAGRYSVMITILCYVYATLNYQTHQTRIGAMMNLEVEMDRQGENMRRLTELYDELGSSHRITEAMMLTTSEILKNDRLDEVLQLALDEAVKLIPNGQAGSILTIDGGKMYFRAATGYSLANLQKIVLAYDELFQAKQENVFAPAIIQNLEVFDEVHLSSDNFELFKNRGALVAKAVLTCSFRSDGEFFGTINIDNFVSADIFTEQDKTMISHLARQLEIIISIHKLYEKAIRPTKYDELTQAYSRRHHMELMTKALAAAKADGTQLTICTIDINLFKEINDRYGHDAGDRCLRHFADAVRAHPVEGMIFSRFGGDEFAFVFPGYGVAETAAYVETLRADLDAHPCRLEDRTRSISFACGIAAHPEDGDDLDVLIRLSDARMYEDKAAWKKRQEEPRAK